MKVADGTTFGPNQVCAAAGLPRATFNSWLSRQYLPVAPGRGMGKERRLTLLDAVRVAVVAELNRLGVSIGVAGKACDLIGQREITHQRMALILTPSSKPLPDDDALRIPPIALVSFSRFEQIEHYLRIRVMGGAPMGFTMIDITAVADRTRAALENPEVEHAPGTWLDADDRLGTGHTEASSAKRRSIKKAS